jgi:hypothetical protein
MSKARRRDYTERARQLLNTNSRQARARLEHEELRVQQEYQRLLSEEFERSRERSRERLEIEAPVFLCAARQLLPDYEPFETAHEHRLVEIVSRHFWIPQQSLGDIYPVGFVKMVIAAAYELYGPDPEPEHMPILLALLYAEATDSQSAVPIKAVAQASELTEASIRTAANHHLKPAQWIESTRGRGGGLYLTELGYRKAASQKAQ